MMRPAGVAAALVAMLAAAACSKTEDPSILGHWRAERVQVASVQLPIGPDIVIDEHAISSPDAEASLPVKDIERKGDEVVLDLPYGVGLSFYIDGPDRMYIKVPFAGRVYYRRVVDAAQVQRQTAAASDALAPLRVAQPVLPAPVPPVVQTADYQALMQQAQAAMRDGATAQAETLLMQAGRYPPAHPEVDYDQAVLTARCARPDLAIEHLNDAFKRGFRQFARLDSTRDFDALKTDVRYQALVARYR
ncbi:hypothetical protein [Paraburkholderia sp.]|jgi:hypothetical protein|uniref:hypothetical protein n=1 Tax=Paraburkholderia sp. TaxID=1926495 RepID=UPI002F3F8B09